MFHTFNKPQEIHWQMHTHFQLHQAISEQERPRETSHLEDTEYKWLYKGDDKKKTHYVYIALRILKEQQKMLLKTTPQRKIVIRI